MSNLIANESIAIVVAQKYNSCCILLKETHYSPDLSDILLLRESKTDICIFSNFVDDLLTLFDSYNVFIIVNYEFNSFETILFRKLIKTYTHKKLIKIG